MFQRSFTDFDEFASQAQRWELDLRQLDAGPFHAKLLQFAVGDVHVSEAKFNRTIRQHGAPPNGLRTVVVPAVSDLEFEWRGAPVNGNSLMIFRNGSELEAVSRSNLHVFTCSFRESLLANVAHSLGVRDLDELNGEVVQCQTTNMSRVRRLLRRLATQICADQTLLQSARLAESMNAELPQLILRAAATADPRSLQSRHSPQAVASAEERRRLHRPARRGFTHRCRGLRGCSDQPAYIAVGVCRTLWDRSQGIHSRHAPESGAPAIAQRRSERAEGCRCCQQLRLLASRSIRRRLSTALR